MNQMQALRLYRHQGTWAFDDSRFDLQAEPFVLGAEQLIDTMLREQGIHSEEVTVYFSEEPFPGAFRFIWMEDQFDGAWYANEHGRLGWLCPAGLFYFPEGWPEMFWAKVVEHD